MRGAFRAYTGRLSAGGFLLVAVFGLAPSLKAQFNGDPFDPYRASYRSSTIPMATQFGPGRARVVTPPGMGSVPGIGVPWDASFTNPTYPLPSTSRFSADLDLLSPSNDVYRRYDAEFGRVYRPNAEADEQFARMQEARQELYFQAMRETDPERKAELRRQYQDLSRRISLGMSPTSRRDSQAPRTGQEGAAPRISGQPDRTSGDGFPRTVRSYEDLAQWSRAINRQAVAVGIVRPDSN
ncbi:hypothetical protein [Tautonia marina]|uniref:hypothetical protein n=1 Tax=Tautonia marina TaxID=2653855 RepID=UPI0012610226|nr:hypothetical protein [Tautonia marina]